MRIRRLEPYIGRQDECWTARAAKAGSRSPGSRWRRQWRAELDGHEAGDELLQAVAGRLTHCVRTEDTVGRLGGDESWSSAGPGRRADGPGAVRRVGRGPVRRGIPNLAAAVRVARRTVRAVDTPIVVDGRLPPASASVGVALSDDASLPDELLRQADSAMYTARRARITSTTRRDRPNSTGLQHGGDLLYVAQRRDRLKALHARQRADAVGHVVVQ
ncbi:diguanylate cyclase domain-containing protein [Dactylosporangium sp. CA-233914]|uniref:diguanylate cyclase domain-containing protein n=1 Tax=Dactylosporangium sp. CA-233914 TaxID=3239934 RepID=UPI003D8E2DC1